MLEKDRLNRPESPTGTANAEEIAKFDRLAREWRALDGKFRAVHDFNAARIPLLLSELKRWRAEQGDDGAPPSLAGMSVADIGCATGLVSEAVAAAGADVVAIDAAHHNIGIARQAATKSGLSINYRVALPEELAAEGRRFDVVLSLEIVEHVADLAAFLDAVATLARPGGLLVIGTLNRTVQSFLKAIVGAEYVFGMLPRGTHDWRAFVRPQELDEQLRHHDMRRLSLHGVELDPLRWRWRATGNPAVNYMAFYRKAE